MWAAAGAAVGLLAGAALRGTVFKLSVASGEPERTACLRCSAPARRRFALRCGQCGRSLGTPLALELATAGVVALVLGRFGGQPDAVAFAFFGVLGVALGAIDIAVQRLPDLLTLPAYPILITLLTGAAIAEPRFRCAAAGAAGRSGVGRRVLAASTRAARAAWRRRHQARRCGWARHGLARVAHPDRRSCPRFCALSVGEPGFACRAAHHSPQRDLLRPIPPRRCAARDAHEQGLIARRAHYVAYLADYGL